MDKSIIGIALDALDSDILQEGFNEGKLPFIRSLIDKGGMLPLDSLVHLSSGCPWSSFTTGTSPAKHGIFYYHRQFVLGTYTVEKKYANQIKQKPFWHTLDQKKIALIDIPETYPLPHFAGLHLVNWGVESPNWKKSSSPTQYIREVQKKYGTYPPEEDYQMKSYDTLESCSWLLELLKEGLQKKKSIILDALKKNTWDLFLASFAESHWVGHALWHIHDKNHPKHNPSIREQIGDPILTIYEALDQALAEIYAAVPNSTFFIFSVSGLAPNYSGSHLLPEMLNRLGYGAPEPTKKSINSLLPAKRWGPYAIQRLEDLLGMKNIVRAKKIFPRKLWDTLTRQFTSVGNDWAKSKAFAVPNGWSGAIRLNLDSRDPQGKVQKGKEYDQLCDAIETALKEMINLETKEPAVDRVIRLRELYQGACLESLPDLIVIWKTTAPIRSLASERIGALSGESPDRRSGAHQAKGVFITANKNIFNSLSKENPSILDLAPTFLTLLVQPTPDSFDGKSLL